MNNKKVSLMSLLFEGKEHDRLETLLKEYAIKKGFNAEVSFKNGMNPDVLLEDSNGNLFMGDAKDSENETVDNDATTKRIAKYIKEYSRIYKRGEISGGCIAVATNELDAANEWKTWLNSACSHCGLINPSFSVSELDRNTYIIIWQVNLQYTFSA